MTNTILSHRLPPEFKTKTYLIFKKKSVSYFLYQFSNKNYQKMLLKILSDSKTVSLKFLHLTLSSIVVLARLAWSGIV